MATYGYARVSSRGQAAYGNGLEAQRKQLADAGCEATYSDVFTGTTMDRPAWDELVACAVAGDTIVVTKLDRIARTAPDGIETVRSLVERGVSVRILNMGLVEDTPVGRMMLTVMFAMAEFERDLIAERMADGKAVARTREGWREGRPRREVDRSELSRLSALVDAGGMTATDAARELGVSRSKWYALRREGLLVA